MSVFTYYSLLNTCSRKTCLSVSHTARTCIRQFLETAISSIRFLISWYPSRSAIIGAVSLRLKSGITFALLCIRNFTREKSPFSAAANNAVRPATSVRFIFAPLPSSISTASLWPPFAASSNAWSPRQMHACTGNETTQLKVELRVSNPILVESQNIACHPIFLCGRQFYEYPVFSPGLK